MCTARSRFGRTNYQSHASYSHRPDSILGFLLSSTTRRRETHREEAKGTRPSPSWSHTSPSAHPDTCLPTWHAGLWMDHGILVERILLETIGRQQEAEIRAGVVGWNKEWVKRERTARTNNNRTKQRHTRTRPTDDPSDPRIPQEGSR